tara:strand:+ start:191 stop:802 length:612 start_codon:yes stop_codon:yes gene_type:complete
MFYRPGTDDPKPPHSPFKAIVAPRPIGWISTRNADGTANLAPYSFFNAISDAPPMVMFGSTGSKQDRARGKDSLANIRASGEFVVNIVSRDLVDAMNITSGPYDAGHDEFELAGLQKAPCRVVDVPRVAASPAALECRLWRIIELPGDENSMTIGEVVGIHIQDRFMENEMLNVAAYQPVARLGYRDYCAAGDLFQLTRPGQK